MKEVQTLFDVELQKEAKQRPAIAKLITSLKRELNASTYKFRILASRVYYGKIHVFPKGINKEDWLEAAKRVWADAGLEGVYETLYIEGPGMATTRKEIKLFDKKKANQ